MKTENYVKNELIDRITNSSIVFIALISGPLNIIIFFALQESEYQIIRIFPPLFGLIAIMLAIFKTKIEFNAKIWMFIGLMFCAAWFNLLLGLLDLASLWFILAIIYTLFISQNILALSVYLSAFVSMLVVGILMMTKITFIPLEYNFENCQFACVSIRILHFLLISSLVYKILKLFLSTIQSNIKTLQKQAEDLIKTNHALENEMNEKKELQGHLLETVILTEEKERKRIASDLHDGLGPVLSAVNLYFQAYIDAPKGNDKNNIEAKLKTIIDDAITDVSRISHNISPHILENYGLATALKTFIDQLNHNEKLKIELQIGSFNRFELKQELTVYRTITELINNTIKHAQADQIIINIERVSTLLTINYEDNGHGFSANVNHIAHAGIGIQNIQNRIQSLGGNITFSNSENGGMKASIAIPYIETVQDETN